MNIGEFLDTLKSENISVFDTGIASSLLKKSRGYTKLFLHRHRGRFIRVIRGIYALQGTSEYVIASHIIYPSYISFISALYIYDLTTQIPDSIIVATYKQHSPINYANYIIKFVKFPKERLFGYTDLKDVVIAEPEKAIVDSVYRNPSSEEVMDAIEKGIQRGLLSRNRLLDYATKMKSRAVIEKIKAMLKEINGDE